MNIVYNASAGTGKTFQVTRLYEELVLEEEVDPRDILLMTFTDNAAAELRMRVAHRLLKARRTAEAEDNDIAADRAIRAQAHLPAAPISTIHAFCTRLLREHALEAGLSPGFSTLVGDERDELLQQISRDELLRHLETDPDFRTFCSGMQMISTGGGFGASITETVPALISQAGSLGISLDNAESMLPEPVAAVSRIDFEHICTRIRELDRITPAVQKALDIITQSLQKADTVEDVVAQMEQLGIKKFGRGAKQISDDFWELKEATKEAALYRKRYPSAKSFARYVQTVSRNFQRQKHEMDTVDFDDQLRLAAQLLKSGKAAPAFKYVIVDEVQDTSRIQCDIIQALWTIETNLVICGDKKQSIYTWRGADPQVMPDLETLILEAGGKLENLQTSYRSKAPILDIVNRLFESVYDETDYTATDRLEANPDFATDNENPCIEFLTPDDDPEDLTRQEVVASEMEAVANRIQLLVSGSPDWYPIYRYSDGFQPTSAENLYRYSDILILLRRTTHQSALEQALRHAGIPYTLGGKGGGLFSRQETRDVSLFLNVITNPNDMWSLIGFLRSPWVGLSDEVIAELAWSNGAFSIDHLMAQFKPESGVTEKDTIVTISVTTAKELVQRYREQLGTKLASELVRMLIDETGFDALQAGRPRGSQRLANLRKVLDWLREHERGAHTTSAAVARKLAEQIKNPPKVPEAALLDPAQNAVTIMTVHGSKGLTKRVVMLPDISHRPNADRSFTRIFFDDKQQPVLGLKLTAPDKSSTTSPGFKAANGQAKTVREHELKNLFYVAMTRARDLVITSASVGQTASGWLPALQPLLGNGISTIPYSRLASAVENAEPKPRNLPTAPQLTAALDELPPPPAPPSLRRISATRLANEDDRPERQPDDQPHLKTLDNATAMGSLGHAILEQLALNQWVGSVKGWLERLRDGFGIDKSAATLLEERIERTQHLMRDLTGEMTEIRPELPFVLYQDHQLIDGTIDLLCRNSKGIHIYDYKFTESDDDAITEQYQSQMETYRTAASRMYGENACATELVVINSTGPRQLPILF